MRTKIPFRLKKVLRAAARLWTDCSGSASPLSLILATTVFTIGTITGLVTLRDHLAQQYADVATALDQLDQSWSYDVGIDRNADGDFDDPDECEWSASFSDTPELVDLDGQAPGGLSF